MKLQKYLAVSESGFAFLSNTGDTFILNETANFILHQIQQGYDKETIVENLMENYDVDKITSEKDVNDFISQIKHFNLVE